jgi:glycosyltransferase involved in cell wall biosynthesis
MKIAIFAPLLGVEATGQSVVVANTANHLAAAGHSVTVLATDCGYQGAPVSQFVVMDTGVVVHIFPAIGTLNRRLYRSQAAERWIASHIDEFDLLDVHGIWSFSGIAFARTFRRHGKPYALTPHGAMTRYDWQKSALRRKLFFIAGFDKIWRNADAVRFTSEGEADNSYYPANCLSIVIPNGVDAAKLSTQEMRISARARLGLPQNAAVLFFMGRITHQKGAKETLAAFELAAQTNSSLYLLLAGPLQGIYGDEVVELIQKSSFRNQIITHGTISGDIKADHILAADAFISLSYNEGLSLSLLEALSHGLPLILTESSNLDHFADYGAGILTSHDTKEAAQAILKIMGDNSFRQKAGQQARRLVEEKFLWSKVIPRLTALYQELLSTSSSVR